MSTLNSQVPGSMRTLAIVTAIFQPHVVKYFKTFGMPLVCDEDSTIAPQPDFQLLNTDPTIPESIYILQTSSPTAVLRFAPLLPTIPCIQRSALQVTTVAEADS